MSQNNRPSGDTQSSLIVNNRLYDKLKFVAQIVLPASGALYFGLAQIWGLPNAEEIVGTITVTDTFLGAVLLISNKQYRNSDAKYDGVLQIDTADPEKDVYTFEVTVPLDELTNNQALTIKVDKPTV